MPISTRGRRFAFIVTIWEEQRDHEGNEPLWRGMVDDVHASGPAYFDSLSALCDYLQQHVDIIRPPHRAPLVQQRRT